MTRRQATVATSSVILLLFSVLPLSPVGAFHEPDLPFVEEIPFEDDAWAAWRVSVPEDSDPQTISGELFGLREEAPVTGAGAWVLHGDGSVDFAIVITSMSMAMEERHIGTPVGEYAAQVEGGSTGYLGLSMTTTVEPGESKILLLIVGTSGTFDGDFRFWAAEGARVEGSTNGESVYAYDRDFEGGVNVIVREPVQGGWLHAKTILDSSFETETQERFYGLFRGGANSGILEMSYDAPGGGGTGETTYFLHGGSPGDYTFTIDRNVDTWDNLDPAISLCWNVWHRCHGTHVTLLGADVRLP